MPAVPMGPQVSFQPFNAHLDQAGFSEQCEQQDNWCHEQDQQYTLTVNKRVQKCNLKNDRMISVRFPSTSW